MNFDTVACLIYNNWKDCEGVAVMKKILCVLLLAGMVAVLGACRSDEPRALDFKSILDVELDTIFSLGDTRESIEAVLGRPIRHENLAGPIYEFEYQNGLVVWYRDGVAVFFEAENEHETGRFEIFGYRIGMTRSRIANIFDFNERWSDSATSSSTGRRIFRYERFYDAEGEVVEVIDNHFIVQIEWVEGGERDLIRLSIMANPR